MRDLLIFIFGFIVTLMALSPLAIALFVDLQNKEEES